jgi:hypothetical protein
MSQTGITETAQMTHARQLGNKDVGNSTIHHAEEITAINHVAATEEETISQLTNMAGQKDHHTEHEEAAVESKVDHAAENPRRNNVETVI